MAALPECLACLTFMHACRPPWMSALSPDRAPLRYSEDICVAANSAVSLIGRLMDLKPPLTGVSLTECYAVKTEVQPLHYHHFQFPPIHQDWGEVWKHSNYPSYCRKSMSHVYGNVCLNLTGKLLFIQRSQVTEQKAHLAIYSRLVSVLMWDKSASDYPKTANAAREALRHCYILNRTKTALPVLMDVLFVLLSTDCAKIYRYKNSTGASPVVQWIMSVKITGWSSEYTNRMCYGDTWGSSSLGIFLLAAPVGRFIM